jgi:hypothetical protein
VAAGGTPELRVSLPRKTPQAAQLLGITYWHLLSLLRAGKLAPPGRDSSGHYLWADADLEAAKRAIGTDRRRRSNRKAVGA